MQEKDSDLNPEQLFNEVIERAHFGAYFNMFFSDLKEWTKEVYEFHGSTIVEKIFYADGQSILCRCKPEIHSLIEKYKAQFLFSDDLFIRKYTELYLREQDGTVTTNARKS